MAKKKSKPQPARNQNTSVQSAQVRSPSSAPSTSNQATVNTIEVMAAQLEHFSGPLPPPSWMANYEELVPGSAREIIDVFIEQSRHRMNLETHVIHHDSRRADGGLVAGLIVVLACLATAAYVAAIGHPNVAGVIVGMDLLGLVGAFIYGTLNRRQEREQQLQTAVKQPSSQR